MGTAALSGGALAYATRKTREVLEERQVPWMGVMAAFIFAAQMINYPVMGGTSGHLLGGVLAALVLGPWAAMIVIATILGIQCVFFQDGGLTALGANIFNMAVIGVWTGYGIVKGLQRFHDIALAASWADRVIILNHGSILADGGTEILQDRQLLASARLLNRLL